MQRLGSLLCLIAVASAQVDPRGARPVEHGTRGDKCATQKEWPFCTSDDWGSKCPSGCRVQGLLDKNDHGLLKRIEKIRGLLDQNKARHRSTDHGSKQTYDYIREKLVLDSGSNNNFYDLAQTLRQRITDMKIKIDGQSRTLAAMKQRVKDQVLDMQRLEIDIDIKLRSCKGSCAKYQEHQVDRDSYVSLDKQIQQLDSQSAQTVQSVGTLYVMKSRPLKDLIVDPLFKSRDVDPTADPSTAQQTVDVFPDVNTMHLILEEEGSSSSPATVSKVPVCLKIKQEKKDGRRLHSDLGMRFRRRCEQNADVPMCSDQDWDWKCPSGCRLQAWTSRRDEQLDGKLRTLCESLRTAGQDAQRTARAGRQLYGENRRTIVSRTGSELDFVAEAGNLSGNLTLLRKQSLRLRRRFQEMSVSVKKQLAELYREEVELDMTLRSCSGSCRSAPPFAVDHLTYRTLRQETDLMHRTVAPPAAVPRLELWRQYSSSAAAVQTELLTQFKDIGLNRLVLEESAD